jgi:predicted kinase
MEAVIFIGIQATGKSTFYKERFFNTHVRINLDMLHTRHREDILLDACIRARQSFVVDNTNILARERAKYIALARRAGFEVIGYYFQSRLQDALHRNQQRTGRAVIPEKGLLAKFHAIQRPEYGEGFDRLYFVSIDSDRAFQVVEWHENRSKNDLVDGNRINRT